MNEIKFGTILENAARLAGRDPATLPIPSGWKVLAGMAIESGLHAIAAEKFPLMQRVEFRRYRPDYDPQAVYAHGQEVWFEGEYRRWMDSSWERLKLEEVAKFIEFDQPWEPVAMQSFGLDVTRFAYRADPRYHPDTPPIEGCKLCELGVSLPDDAPAGVFVKFVPEYPRLDFAAWVSGTAYSAGDAVYREGTKDVYQAVSGIPDVSRTIAPEDDEVGLWRPLRIRGEFAAYLTRLVAAEFLTEDQGKHQTRAAADREFDLLCERYHEGNGETRVRVGRFTR